LTSGTKDERSAKAERLAIDPDYDLAVLRVKDVKNLPEPIKFEKGAELAETMTVYTFRFPVRKGAGHRQGPPGDQPEKGDQGRGKAGLSGGEISKVRDRSERAGPQCVGERVPATAAWHKTAGLSFCM
jgi:hypothetical protein